MSPDDKNAKDKTTRDRNSEKANPWVQLARYSQLAFVFPAATVVGWLIGAALDRWLHTTWLYLAGLILGIVAGFVELIRAALSSESK
jgi:F0F1-type ATP synthase assembly protein I